MAQTLAPEGFIPAITDPNERRIVRALDGLPGPWFVLPNRMGRLGGRDWEIDVVLLHRQHGVIILEVKGYLPEIIQGSWCRDGFPDDPSPEKQARDNAGLLRGKLRDADLGFGSRSVEYAVCFPNARAVDGVASTGLAPEQVITASDTDSLDDALADLVTWSRKTGPIDDLLLYRLIKELAPDSHFEWDREHLAVVAREKMQAIADHQIDALVSLRANRRVAISGAAGTGKTRLAVKWARDATYDDPESTVLLTCFNRPLADVLSEELAGFDNITVAPVLEFFEDRLAQAGRPVGADGDDASLIYNMLLPAALHESFQLIDGSFDTIIIDEAQDFSPGWIGLLESLLDPHGMRSMLVLFDQSQEIYSRGFRPPQPEDGWVVASLARNCRNADEIARLLYQRFNAARMTGATPAALACEFVPAEPPTVVTVVRDTLARLDAEGRKHRNVLVQTDRNSLRDRLRDELGLLSWEEWFGRPETDGVLCENVRRVKGLEFDTAILVISEGDWSDELLYVGASRAVSGLVVVGPPELANRLGMVNPSP